MLSEGKSFLKAGDIPYTKLKIRFPESNSKNRIPKDQISTLKSYFSLWNTSGAV